MTVGMRRLGLARINGALAGLVAALVMYCSAGLAEDSLEACPGSRDFDLASIRAQMCALKCQTTSIQATINRCAWLAANESEAQLRLAYSSLMETFADEETQAQISQFASAQRAWCAYRDAICAYDAGPTGGGTMSSMIGGDCRMEYDNARAKALVTLRQCITGATDCQRPLQFFYYELHPDKSP